MTSRRTIDHTALAATWQTTGIEGEVTSTALARRPPTFVAPDRTPAPVAIPLPAILANTPTQYADAWQAGIPTQREVSTPVDRAKATGLRMAAWGVIWLGAGLLTLALLAIVGARLPVAALLGAGVWVGATAVTGYRISRIDADIAPGGIERHRIDRGAQVEIARMEHDFELRRMALAAWLRSLEGTRRD